MRESLILLLTLPGFVALVASSGNWGHAIPFGLIMVGLLCWSIAARVRKSNRRARQNAYYRAQH